MATIETRATPWCTVLLICGKCSRKMDGGYGDAGRDTLRGALRGALRSRGHGRDVRVVETRCLGLCPKKAVVAVNGHRPAVLLSIPKGTFADEALKLLLPS